MSRFTVSLRRAAEAVAALFMFLMFATFILQVAIRYGARLESLTAALPFLNPNNFSWTLEFCLALWVWLIFWGNAFIVRAEDHVSFDVLSQNAPEGVRRIFMIVAGLIIGGGLLLSIEPTWSRFAILRLKKPATLQHLFGGWIRMRDVYAIYILFLVVVGLRALWSVVRAVKGDASLIENEEGEAE